LIFGASCCRAFGVTSAEYLKAIDALPYGFPTRSICSIWATIGASNRFPQIHRRTGMCGGD
jgi:hypothetical protein